MSLFNGETPEFFRLCPFCKMMQLAVDKYGVVIVKCDCGISMRRSAANWEGLAEMAKHWNRTLAEVQNEDAVE